MAVQAMVGLKRSPNAFLPLSFAQSASSGTAYKVRPMSLNQLAHLVVVWHGSGGATKAVYMISCCVWMFWIKWILLREADVAAEMLVVGATV
jgi:hypothetical protein